MIKVLPSGRGGRLKTCDMKMDRMELRSLADRAVREMTERIAKFLLIQKEVSSLNLLRCSSLVVRTSGEYEASLILNADDSYLEEIARRMKHSEEVTAQDVAMYTTEFYNILCGFLISQFNSIQCCKARFGIPKYTNNSYIQGLGKKDQGITLYYQNQFGAVQLQVIDFPVPSE